jgi:hypothetical protein
MVPCDKGTPYSVLFARTCVPAVDYNSTSTSTRGTSTSTSHEHEHEHEGDEHEHEHDGRSTSPNTNTGPLGSLAENQIATRQPS